MKETDKVDEVEIPQKRPVVLLGILCMVLTIGLVSACWFWLQSENYVKDIMQENANIASALDTKISILNDCHQEMEDMKKRLEGIKNADDLLKRDIFLYIDKKFQLIPRTVALDIAEQILTVSKEADVSPELIVGIIQVESSFNPMAISSKNARGLMQVMPEWAKKFNLKKVTDLHDIDTNIKSGVKVLKIHIKEGKGSISKGLYYYVGRSDSYAKKVYSAMGKFVAFRSTVDDDHVDIDINGNGDGTEKKGDKDESGVDNGTGHSNKEPSKPNGE